MFSTTKWPPGGFQISNANRPPLMSFKGCQY